MIRKTKILLTAFIQLVRLIGLKKVWSIGINALKKKNHTYHKRQPLVTVNRTNGEYTFADQVYDSITEDYVNTLELMFNSFDEWRKKEIILAITDWAIVFEKDLIELGSIVKMCYETNNWTSADRYSLRFSKELQWLTSKHNNK